MRPWLPQWAGDLLAAAIVIAVAALVFWLVPPDGVVLEIGRSFAALRAVA